MQEIKDFTVSPLTPPEPKVFKVDDDIFYCAAEIPAGAMTYLAKLAKMDQLEQIASLGEWLDMVVLPDSAERFAQRLRDPLKPITTAQLGQIFKWLIEVYTARPTGQPSSSVPGQSTTGTSSTAGALPVG